MNLSDKFFPENAWAYFSPKEQDFTLPKDSDELPSAQREYLQRELNLPLEKIFYGRQVHGRRIVVVTPQDIPMQFPIQAADGFVTNIPGVALCVRTADCLPIFLFDPTKNAVGMVHAGWKGTSERIAAAAVETMQREYGSQPQDILVVFGPCIRRCCYEVGEEFGNIFPDETFMRFGKYFMDLALANRNHLLEAGVVAEHIHDKEFCTCCGEGFFSHRWEGDTTGRHLSFVMILG